MNRTAVVRRACATASIAGLLAIGAADPAAQAPKADPDPGLAQASRALAGGDAASYQRALEESRRRPPYLIEAMAGQREAAKLQ